MSYSIMYNWAFIRSNEGITPVVLMGDNNVTERHWYGNRWGERRARDWDCFRNLIGVSEQEFLDDLNSMTGGPYQEHWMRNSKWVDDAAMMRWGKKAVQEAAPIEDILNLNRRNSVQCYLSVWDTEFNHSYENRQNIKTTEELDAWIRKCKEIIGNSNEIPKKSFYPVIDWGMEYIRRPSPQANSLTRPASVIIKHKGRYLADIRRGEHGDGSSSHWSRDIKKAKVFTYEEALGLQRDPDLCGVVQGNLLNAKAKDYPYDAVIRMENKAKSLFHCYVSKNTARRVSWCYEPDNAIKYKNQKAAEKAAVRLRSRFLGWEFTVEII